MIFQGVFGDDEFKLAVFGTFIITNVIYWSVGGIFSFFDITGTPKFLRKYKVYVIVVIDIGFVVVVIVDIVVINVVVVVPVVVVVSGQHILLLRYHGNAKISL